MINPRIIVNDDEIREFIEVVEEHNERKISFEAAKLILSTDIGMQCGIVEWGVRDSVVRDHLYEWIEKLARDTNNNYPIAQILADAKI